MKFKPCCWGYLPKPVRVFNHLKHFPFGAQVGAIKYFSFLLPMPLLCLLLLLFIIVVAVDKRLHSVYTRSVEIPCTLSSSSLATPPNGIAPFSQCVMQIAADAVIAAHYGQANVLDSKWERDWKTGNGKWDQAMPMPGPG